MERTVFVVLKHCDYGVAGELILIDGGPGHWRIDERRAGERRVRNVAEGDAVTVCAMYARVISWWCTKAGSASGAPEAG